jgi:hypothetical protein
MSSIYNELKLRDFFYFYPDQFSEDIQTIITSKREFAELASSSTDVKPMKGSIYFRHQEFVRRFMYVYDRLLLIHRTGTGKSCSAFGASEQFKVSLISEFIDFYDAYYNKEKDIIKKIYVLTRGDLINRELFYQLVCKCSYKERYFNMNLKELEDEEKIEKKVNKEVKKRYSFDSFITFSNSISTNISKDPTYYENCMFILDEVHILTSTESIKTSDISLMDPTEFEENKNELVFAYNNIKNLFLNTKNIKIILMTATPMINSIKEIVPLMNLILPPNRQIPEKDVPAIIQDPENIRQYFRGIVSFVREIRPKVDIIREGSPITYINEKGEEVATKINFYVLEMGDIQSQYYLNTRKNGFQIELRQASNFVFPDLKSIEKGKPIPISPEKAKTGSSSMSMMISEFNNRLRKIDDDVYEFKYSHDLNFFSSIDNISLCSAKFAEVINQCKSAPGNCFVYTEFLKGSGALLLSVLFKAQGFIQFSSEEDLFVKSREYEKRASFSVTETPAYRKICLPETMEGTEFKKEFRPAPRFALITSETPKKRRDNIFKIFNSYQNRHGDYIKVIIGSKISRAAINLNNVVQIHIMEPSWNRSNIYQAESRGLRAGSHDMISKEGERVEVQIFHYVSSLPDSLTENIRESEFESDELKSIESSAEEEIEELGSLGKELSSPRITIDIILAILSEKKDISIRKMERIMKEMAVDCVIHKARNVLPTDEPGSPDNDYSMEPLVCYSEKNNENRPEIDQSSYNIVFPEKEVHLVSSLIKESLNYKLVKQVDAKKAKSSQRTSQTEVYVHQDFLNLFKRSLKTTSYLISSSIHKLITSKVEVVNDIMTQSVIKEDGKYLYHDPFDYIYSEEDNSINSYYAENLFAQRYSILDSYVRKEKIIRDKKLIQDLERQNDKNLIEKEIVKLSFPTLMEEFEKACVLILLEESENVPFYLRVIYEKYQSLVYMMEEPVEQIVEKENFLMFREIEKRPGRRRIKNIVRVRPGLKMVEGKPIEEIVKERIKEPKKKSKKATKKDERETVLVHILRSIESQKTLYAKISRTMKGFFPRIYKPSEKMWRDMNFAEVEVYIGLIQAINNRRIREFGKDKKIFGIISDGTFWIVHKTYEKEEEIVDTRKRARGKVCKNYNKQALLNIIKELRDEGYEIEDVSRDDKKKICEVLEDFFQKNNLLFKL